MRSNLLIKLKNNSECKSKYNLLDKSQNKMSLKELFKISKFVYKESFLDGSLEVVGKEKVIEDPSAIQSSKITLKFITAFMLAFLNISTVLSLIQLNQLFPNVNENNFSSYLFAISSILSIQYAMQLLYLLVFGLTILIGFFGGKAFKFLETVPLNDDEIKKIVFFTFYRSVDYQLIVMFLGLPIVTIFCTGSIIAALTALIVSGFHLIFGISVMIFVGKGIARIFSMDQTSKGKTILKMSISILYVLVTVSMGLIFTFVSDLIGNLFLQNLATGENGFSINAIFSFIPYPFALNYFYGISLFPVDKFYINQAWPSILGFLISIIVIVLIFRKSLGVLRSVSREVEIGTERKSVKSFQKIKVEKLTVFKKDLIYATRNFSAMIYILMPLFFPLMMIFMMSDMTAENFMDIRFMSNVTGLIYMGMGLMWTLMAATGSENDTGGLLQTLPINHSDVYYQKRKFLLIFISASNITPAIFQLIRVPSEYISILVNFSAMMIISFYGVELILLLYSRLFGKIRDKYTLLELNPERKIDKAILIIIIIYIAIVMPFITAMLIDGWIKPGFRLGISSEMYWIELIVAVIIFSLVRYSANKIFGGNRK